MLNFINKILKINKNNHSDVFVKRLRSSVIGEGMLTVHNESLIKFAIDNLPKGGDILEIGLYGGLSSNLILHYLEKAKLTCTLFGCDIWEYEGFEDDKKNRLPKHIDGKENVLRKDYNIYMKQSYINACKLLHPSNLPYAYHLNSDTFFKFISNKTKTNDVFNREAKYPKKLSFCYIDGNHSYEQTKKDFKNVSLLLLKGGFILLDDTAKHLNFGSAKFANELKTNKDFKIVNNKENYLIQKL